MAWQGRTLRAACGVAVFGLRVSPHVGVDGTPNIPTIGGVALQTNVTGVWLDVAVGADDSFVAAGSKGESSAAYGSQVVGYRYEDGLLARYTGAGVNLWVRSLSFGLSDELYGVELDSSDNIFAVGTTSSPQLQNQSTTWGWAFKYLPDGTQSWSLNVTISGYENVDFEDIVLDGNDLYIVGSAQASSDVFPILVRISSSGSLLGTTVFTSHPCHVWESIRLGDGSGTFYVNGVYLGCEESDPDVGCVGKIASNYSVSWLNCDEEYGSHFLAAARSGNNLASAGFLSDGSTLYWSTLNLDADGDLGWSSLFELALESLQVLGMGLSVDSNSNSFTSTYNGTVELEGSLHPLGISVTVGSQRMLSMKHDSSGDLEWTTEYGYALSAHVATSNALDDSGRLLVAGARFKLTDPVEETVHPFVIRYEDL